MRAIVVDDEPLMLKHFERVSRNIADLSIRGKFHMGCEALDYVRENPVDVAFLDVEMPVMDGLTLAQKLRVIYPGILIVFVSSHDKYVGQSNRIGGDYYLMKDYDPDVLETMMERLRLLVGRQKKKVYIQTFGSFEVRMQDKCLPLVGKAKEILAYLVAARGKEISNRMIYSVLWEKRRYDSFHDMNVYYNALRRLKKTLGDVELSELLISSTRGQRLNTEIVDCDYYSWLEKNPSRINFYAADFMSEYSWGEEENGKLFMEWIEKDEPIGFDSALELKNRIKQ